MYMWNGALTTEKETLLLIKTFKALAEEVKLKILADHPYETPALLTLPVTGANTKFLNWMTNQIST